MTRKKTPQEQLQENGFSPRFLEVVNTPPLPLPRLMLYVLLVLVFLLILWSIFGRLDIVARAQGKLIPQTRIKIAQPFEGGRIAKILVKDGDIVKIGQPIMVMDTQLSEADTEKLRTELTTSKIMLRGINAELEEKEFTRFPEDKIELFSKVNEQNKSRRKSYLHSITQQTAVLNESKQDLSASKEIYKKLQETLLIHQQNERNVEKLGKKGYVTKLDILEKQRIRIEAEGNTKAQKFTMQAAMERINELRGKLNEIKSQYRSKLLDEQISLKQRVDQLDQDWLKQEYRNRLMNIKAPQDGFIKDIATNTEGTVVPAGTVLMNIVPINEPLLAEVYVSNQDVGFISAGQKTRIKMMSYQFQKYGMIDGEVDYVSADANVMKSSETSNNDEEGSAGYKTIISLSKQFLERNDKKFLLRPGMQVTAEIKLGTRTVLEYILSPIQKTIGEAGMER